MKCNQLIKIDSQDVLTKCQNCRFEMCTESLIPWHYGVSCHEDTELRYSEIAKGKSIQL